MGFKYIWEFIAGDTRTGQVAATMVEVSRSSAIPWAIFPRISADAGATRIKSEVCPSVIWCISGGLLLSKLSVRHGCFVNASKVSGVINFAPASVRITWTSQ